MSMIGETKDVPPQEEDVINKQKRKLETLTTAGCGYGRAKQKLLHVFWSYLWPNLEALGWTKFSGTGENDGATYFLPKGIDMKTSRKRRQYYDRVRDVIDRVLEKRNSEEAELAKTYLSMMGVPEGVSTDKPIPTQRRARRSASRSPGPERRRGRSARIDLSWKTAGRSFPKTSSRVGENFQVSHLPQAGSYQNAQSDGLDDESTLCDQVWDPEKAKKANVKDFVHRTVPTNKKEAGMVLLHENGYDASNLLNNLMEASPVDGSDWTDEEKELFRREIFRLRKDIHALSKVMNKSICSCLTYYLGTFKKSDGYRILKTVCSEERAERQAATEQGLDACAICGDGGNLLICDGCEGEYHMTCLRPPLASVPEGNWECDDCVNRKFLDARDYLIRNTKLFEVFDASNKKRKLSGSGVELSSSVESDSSQISEKRSVGTRSRTTSGSASPLGSDTMDGIVFRPSPATMAAIQKMAKRISEALSASPGTEQHASD